MARTDRPTTSAVDASAPGPAARAHPDGDGSRAGNLRRARAVARAQGAFTVLGGLWPLVSIRSFETVYPPVKERYFEYTIGGLMVTNGLTQLLSGHDVGSLRQARRVGLGTALTLTSIDVAYSPRRIGAMYIVDAAMEVGWMLAWARVGRLPNRVGRLPRD